MLTGLTFNVRLKVENTRACVVRATNLLSGHGQQKSRPMGGSYVKSGDDVSNILADAETKWPEMMVKRPWGRTSSENLGKSVAQVKATSATP